MTDDHVTAVDLFCGAGGFSTGLRQACDDLGVGLQLAAINHWEPAVETHERNHPDAHQYHSKVEQLYPPHVIQEVVGEDVDPRDPDVTVDLLVAGPECTHHSNARGGKPVKEQKRMSPWLVLDWLEKLDVELFIIENVKELMSWGPVEDGQPVKDGSIFQAWTNALNKLGYAIDWTTLNAADYGDPTSRERFFIAGSQSGQVTFPEPTHDDADPDKPDRRTAAEIIDWSDIGTSIWTRDITEPRVHTPPKDTTMERIAEGIRRHAPDWLAPYADALEELGRDEIRHLREERVIPREYADVAAEALDKPFLVPTHGGGENTPFVLKQKNNSPCQAVDEPLDTIHANGNHYWLSTASTYLLRQQDGAHPLDVDDEPVPTVATRGGHAIATTELQALIEPKNGPYRDHHSNPLYPPGDRPHHTLTSDPRSKLVTPTLIRYSHGGASLSFDESMPTIATERGGVFALSQPFLTPLYNPRPNQRPRSRSVDRPLMTVVASKPSPATLATAQAWPFIDDCEGNAKALDRPLGTQTTTEKFALVVPELWPWGLDIKYRMLKPSELKQAQGFPESYELTGTKSDQTSQIGNAVPVNLARELCKHLLTTSEPDLRQYGAGIEADPDYEIPDYEEVAQTDD